MKRITSILLAIALMLGLCACNSGTSATLTAEGITLGAQAESTLHINLINAGGLKKYGNHTLGGFQFKVIYDPSMVKLGEAVLAIDSIAKDTNNWSLDYSNGGDGEAMVMVLDNNLEGLIADTVPLIDLPVQAVAGASGECEIKFEIVNICDSVGNDEVRDHITDGSATVTFQ